MNIFTKPLPRHNLEELLEGIHDFPHGLGEHLPVDGAADIAFGLAEEACEVLDAAIGFHVFHKNLLCILELFRGAEVVIDFVFVEAEDFR